MTITSPAPLIVHHKAALDGSTPPNSLAGVEACLGAGAAFIEVDITALAGEDYLLVHDDDLSHETTGTGSVAATRPGDVRDLRLRKRDGTATEHPPALLSEVVRAMVALPGHTRLQLDFKNVIPFADDEPLDRLISLIAPLEDRVIVSTGADWQLRRLRKRAPWLDLGFDVHFVIDWRPDGAPVDPRIPPYRKGAYGYWDDHPLATQRFYPAPAYLAERCEMMVSLVPGLSTFYIDHRLLAQSLDDGFNWAAALHDYGLKLDAWTLDTDNPTAVAHAQRLLAAGVDQFTTNTPAALRDLLHPTAQPSAGVP